MTRLGFLAALAVMTAVLLGCGPAKELPDEIPKTTQPAEKPVVVPKQSDPEAKALVEKVLKAYTGDKPELVEKGKYSRLTLKGKMLPPGSAQRASVDTTRKIAAVWPDRFHGTDEYAAGDVRSLDVRMHRPRLWINGALDDDPTATQHEKNFTADEVGQHWMLLLLPLTDPKAIVFDLQTQPALNAEQQPITIQTIKLSLGEFPLYLLAFDPSSYALVGVEYRVMELGQPILRTLYLSSHKPAGPDRLNLPTKMKLHWYNEIKEDWEVEKWELPTTIGDEEFAPPIPK